MILKFTKQLNDKKEFTLITFSMNDLLDGILVDKFLESNCNVYETSENYYYYIKEIYDIENSEKFKIKVKKGDIVSLTARDNSYIVFPSKRSFAFSFNLNYQRVLNYEYKEILRDGKPFEVKYVKDSELKVNDGVVYTLSQLVLYISELIKGYNYREAQKTADNNDKDILSRVINKYYNSKKHEVDSKYELNIKKCGLDENNKWFTYTFINISKSNRYLYDYYLLRMFAYMIYTKSLKDYESNNLPEYCFDKSFNSLEDVYRFLEDNQDIVNNFFIETEILFNKPNEMYTSYAPSINGVYMYYEYNNVKTYIYRSKEKQFFDEKSLRPTYVSKHYKHKIKNIKSIYSV